MPCFDRALSSRTSLSNQYSMIGSDHVLMKSNRMHRDDITGLRILRMIV